ncbi:MAG TPA: class I adenylate-forming enzyme family protein [Acidimicrobiales bacterium]
MNFTGSEVRQFRRDGWWQEKTVGEIVHEHASRQPGAVAFVEDATSTTWAQYDVRADRLAAVLAGLFDVGDRVIVRFPDGAAVHIAYVAAERAGLVVVGIGWRAGPAEVAHLAKLSGARGLVTQAGINGGRAGEGLGSLVHVAVPERADGEILVGGRPAPPHDACEGWANRRLGPDDLFMLNSTSGTTGLPKCVMHTQNRWFAFHRLALEAGAMSKDDVFLSAIPAPYGFGLWTAHFTPAILGCATAVLPRFSVDGLVRSVQRDRITVLCCVSTQFIMLLNEAEENECDLSSLRVMFTGGEAVPYERARQFEELTGAVVLQFYGSNETGALSRTTLSDSPERRFTTAGRVIPEMNVRLFASELPGRGQPGCRGPLLSLGYWEDPEANNQLFTDDGWMLTGDVVEVDGEGYLSVVGRTSDFIIRGGKNISAPAVEAEIAKHPSVSLVAAVGAPDPVFGERVAAFVTLRPDRQLDLDDLRAHLQSKGVTKEWWPERLVVLDEMPRASGGKIAKGELRNLFTRDPGRNGQTKEEP